MRLSIGASIVGVLGLLYGVLAARKSDSERDRRLVAFGGVGLLIAAIGLIVIPWAMGASW